MNATRFFKARGLRCKRYLLQYHAAMQLWHLHGEPHYSGSNKTSVSRDSCTIIDIEMSNIQTWDWELTQFNKIAHEQPYLAARALRQVLALDADLRWALIISAYRDKLISLAKAAELLEMNPIALRQELTM